MNERTIREYIRALDHMKRSLQNMLKEERKITAPRPKNHDEYLEEFTKLKYLITSGTWPLALPESQMVREGIEEDKIERANHIISNLFSPPKGQRILDYKCKEGHVVLEAVKKHDATFASGYDDEKQEWPKQDRTLFTDNWEKIKEKGPYDTILMMDVLDHEENPLETLNKVKQVKTSSGEIFVRCHPWTSRHATHLYHDRNLAYLHLVFTEKELVTLGLLGKPTKKITDPEKTYATWFKEVGLTIEHEEVHTQEVDTFFLKENILSRRIKENWPNRNGGVFPREYLEIQFIDYFLK